MIWVLIFKFLILKIFVCSLLQASSSGWRGRWKRKVSFVLFIYFYYLYRLKHRRIWNEELHFRTLACYLHLPSMILFYIFRRLSQRPTFFQALTIRDALFPVNLLKFETCYLCSSFFNRCKSNHKNMHCSARETSCGHLELLHYTE